MTKKNDKHSRLFEYGGERYLKSCHNCLNEGYVTIDTKKGQNVKFCLLQAIKVRGQPYRGIDPTVEAKGACVDWKLDTDTLIDMTPVNEDTEG